MMSRDDYKQAYAQAKHTAGTYYSQTFIPAMRRLGKRVSKAQQAASPEGKQYVALEAAASKIARDYQAAFGTPIWG